MNFAVPAALIGDRTRARSLRVARSCYDRPRVPARTGNRPVPVRAGTVGGRGAPRVPPAGERGPADRLGVDASDLGPGAAG